jgi:hypothetical protein
VNSRESLSQELNNKRSIISINIQIYHFFIAINRGDDWQKKKKSQSTKECGESLNAGGHDGIGGHDKITTGYRWKEGKKTFYELKSVLFVEHCERVDIFFTHIHQFS